MAKKNLSKLVKKKVRGKDGKMHTVWVKMGDAKNQPKEKKKVKLTDRSSDAKQYKTSEEAWDDLPNHVNRTSDYHVVGDDEGNYRLASKNNGKYIK